MATSQIYPLELIDETLDINATDNYDLTLELSEEGLSLAVLDLLRGKYVMLRHYPLEITANGAPSSYSDIINSDDFLKRKYSKVFIILPTQLFTLVPSSVYEPGLKEDYFHFNFNVPEKTIVLSNSLPFPEAEVIFSPGDNIINSININWREVTPWHHTKTLLQHVWSACRSSENNYIHCHFEKSFVTLIIMEKRNLTFCNSFPVTAGTDAAYFLFNVLDRKEIRNDETIHVSGTVEPYSETHLSLLNFSPDIKFASPVIRHSFSYVMNEIHLHRWLNLFTAASCE
ncbi:MAG: DUF3822 family protein [Bacteroidales bacterium]|jgi:hypothetical protein|nr:DUF3822 family protein [Bacteroidales bacterium]